MSASTSAETMNDVDLTAPMFSFAAFGTLAAVHSSEEQADFVATAYKPDGAGFSNSWSGKVDSLIAGQVTGTFSPHVSAVVQVVAEQSHDGAFQPHVEWANFRYQFSPDLSLTFGRTALPTFTHNDSRKVGYSLPWVRPPVEVYDLAPITSNDGLGVIYQRRIGSATNTLQLTGGWSVSKFPGGRIGAGEAKARELLSIADTHEWGFAMLHVNFGRTRVSIAALEPLFAALRQFGPPGEALADKYEVNDALVSFMGLGAGYNPGEWFVQAEWGHLDSSSLLGAKTGWYVSGGIRFGTLTPYLNYADVRPTGRTFEAGLDLASLPANLQDPAAQLNGALNSALSGIPRQATYTLGARWDFMRNVAFKLQYDQIALGRDSVGTLLNVQPGLRRGGTVHLFSASLDFVL
ncbi:MAG: hypothetical protein ABIT36_07600 [Steroidobacteraceae bacterium]